MSDWFFLEANRIKSGCHSVPRIYHTDSTAGFNGMFRFVVKSYWVRCIAWRYTGGGPFQMPTPASIMVGPKS